MLTGPGHAFVDFTRSDNHRPNEHDAVNVKNRSLRLIERRRKQQLPGART